MHATHTNVCSVFLSMPVSVGVSQTCIGNDEGKQVINGELELSVESSTGFFMNDASPATCSGTLTQWRYCYYTGQTRPNATTRLGLYRNVGTDTKNYELLSGSETLVTVSSFPSSSFSSFVCGAVAPPQNVTVMPGDIIGACLPESNAIALLSDVSQDMLQESSTCDTLALKSVIDPTSDDWSSQSYLLHVYADIGEYIS